MRSLSILLLIIVISGCSSTGLERINYTIPEYYQFSILELTIVPTFSHPIIYEVARDEPYLMKVSVYDGEGGYDWGEIDTERLIQLSESQYNEIVTLLDQALDFPKKEYTASTDGEVWFLKSALYQFTAVAIANPDYKSKERGLEDFVALKMHLERLMQ